MISNQVELSLSSCLRNRTLITLDAKSVPAFNAVIVLEGGCLSRRLRPISPWSKLYT